MAIYVVSDTHFELDKFRWRYSKEYGTVRTFDGYRDIWNRIVRPVDTVIHLGDVVWSDKALPYLNELNGYKILISGNHDPVNYPWYTVFSEVYHEPMILGNTLLSHKPILPADFKVPRWCQRAGTFNDSDMQPIGSISSTRFNGCVIQMVPEHITLNVHGHWHSVGINTELHRRYGLVSLPLQHYCVHHVPLPLYNIMEHPTRTVGRILASSV